MPNLGLIYIDESIKGMFKAGDFVEIDTDIQTYRGDAVYAYQLAGEKYISPLQKIPNRGLELLLNNHGADDVLVTNNMDFRIVGKIVKGWKAKNL